MHVSYEMIVSRRGVLRWVRYYHLTPFKREWNNCFSVKKHPQLIDDSSHFICRAWFAHILWCLSQSNLYNCIIQWSSFYKEQLHHNRTYVCRKCYVLRRHFALNPIFFYSCRRRTHREKNKDISQFVVVDNSPGFTEFTCKRWGAWKKMRWWR